MKTKREICLQQIELQEEIQKIGLNIVTCGNCGTVLVHRMDEDYLECFCGDETHTWDCPDLYYSGLENNQEFEEKEQNNKN